MSKTLLLCTQLNIQTHSSSHDGNVQDVTLSVVCLSCALHVSTAPRHEVRLQSCEGERLAVL